MIPPEWGLPLAVLLLALDLLIAATRVSMLSLRPLRLVPLREQFPLQVDRTLALTEDARLRPALRFSQTLTRVLLAGVILAMVVDTVAQSRIWLLYLLLVVLLALILMVLEFTVEGSILQEPELWGIRLSLFTRGLVFSMTPLVFLPVMLLKSQWPAPVAALMTEDELKSWVESEQEEGGLEREERQMIYSIIQFGDTLARGTSWLSMSTTRSHRRLKRSRSPATRVSRFTRMTSTTSSACCTPRTCCTSCRTAVRKPVFATFCGRRTSFPTQRKPMSS